MTKDQRLEIKRQIRTFFQGEIDDSTVTLDKYSRDASIFEIRPEIVLYPRNADDVKALVKWVNDNKETFPELSITARAAGTDMSGAAIGESLILDFTRYMNKVLAFEGDRITVQPGMYYRDFEKITLSKGLILPCFTASKSINAVGGMFGNNSAGERTLKYGKTEDYVLEAKVVFADGIERTVKHIPLTEISKQDDIYKKTYDLIKNNEDEINLAKPKVHKNSAGYYLWNVLKENSFDLNKLLVGSQGTLGIATEITYKLLPELKHSNLTVVFLNDLEPLGRLVDEILIQNPETLEAYDNKTMQLAVKFFWDFLKNKGMVGMFKFMWSFIPELKMMLTGGFPKMILLAEFAGESEAEVSAKCTTLVSKLKVFNLKVHITKGTAEADKYWDIRRESFALLRKHVKKLHTAPFIDDIIVRPEFLPKFLPELNKILSTYNLTFTIAGHAGDGNFHIIPLMDFRDEKITQIILDLSEKVYDLVARYHGSITAEHNDGIIRTPYLGKIYNPRILALFAETKKIFDPKNILNPGKKVPISSGAGTKEYLGSHIAIEHTMVHKV
jgi:FAD/FMN-containing dehydrogenase